MSPCQGSRCQDRIKGEQIYSGTVSVQVKAEEEQQTDHDAVLTPVKGEKGEEDAVGRDSDCIVVERVGQPCGELQDIGLPR